MSMDELKELVEKLVSDNNVLIAKDEKGNMIIEHVITKERKILNLIPF